MYALTISSLVVSLRGRTLLTALLFCLILLFAPFTKSLNLPLEKLKLPSGFQISIYAELQNPRQLAVSDYGIVYAGSLRAGNLYRLTDRDSNGVAESIQIIDNDLKLPTGVAFYNGDLYVGAVNEILVYKNIDHRFESKPEPIVLYDELPTETHHGWKYLGFSPNGRLYFNVGAPCNVCKPTNPWFATIMRISIDTPHLQPQIFAHGVRNSVGFDWHPETEEFWFTDNGRDLLGDHTPQCELNRAAKAGLHFGFPYLHGSDEIDPKFGAPHFPTESPVKELGPHTAPLGIKFYEGKMFPKKYRGKMLIAKHGSWNRTQEAGHTGYNISLFDPETGITSTLIEGWLQGNKAWGRPSDIAEMPDGSVLISDAHGNVIYRLTYDSP